jgi:hypothetical protein
MSTTTWTITVETTGVQMAAYIAMRLNQDAVTVTIEQAVQELLTMGGINTAGTSSGPTIKHHGNDFQ